MNFNNSNNKIMYILQKLGKSLMIPISVLPALGIILRLGSPDMLNIHILEVVGNAAFSNLPILFAVGIGFGIAEDNHGAGGLAALIGYYIMTQVANSFAEIINPEMASIALQNGKKIIDMSTFGGIISGITGGLLYNKFKNIKLPEFLGFFNGRRFVPIITSFASLFLGLLFGFIWPNIQKALEDFSIFMLKLDIVGVAIYGFFNRLLIPFGLHHIINNFFWFNIGSFETKTGIVTGDIARFAAGDKTAGIYQAGFFPIMMFGIPGAALAIYICSKKENRKKISGFLLASSFTSFFTGITEPFEFSFMFLSPILYFVHSLLTGLIFAITKLLGVKVGFYFSASAIDLALNWGISTKPFMIFIIGIATFFIYYFVFTFFIKFLNLQVVGKEDSLEEKNKKDLNKINKDEAKTADIKSNDKVSLYINYLGGKDNIISVDSCITRLRCLVKDDSLIKIEELKDLGAKGVIKLGGGSIQVVVGTESESLCSNINKNINNE